MVRIQGFTRKDNSVIHSLTIPKDIIEELGWKKHDTVEILASANGCAIIRKTE